MELPEGWRVGHTKDVSPQWAEEWPKYAKKANSEEDLDTLRFLLEERKSWLFPATVRRFSKMLEDQARKLNFPCRPVRSSVEEKPWHARLTDYPAPLKTDTSRKPADISSRIIGEGDAA